MKRPEVVLRSALLENPSIVMLVGTRIYPLVAPADAVYPFVTWRRVAVQRLQTLSVPAGAPRTTIDYTIYGGSYDQARTLANLLRDTLDGYAGTVDNTVVQRASVENETDDFVTLTGAELPPSYAITMTVETWWLEP